MDPKDRLIVALDVPSVAAASAMVEKLGSSVTFYKIGYQLAFAGGLALADTLIRANKQVFLDLKLHDIGNTVGKGVESVAKLGATFLTVHAYPQTMHAAVDARKGSKLRILGVTVLTSYDDADLAAAGYDFTVPELVAERAAQARGTEGEQSAESIGQIIERRSVAGFGCRHDGFEFCACHLVGVVGDPGTCLVEQVGRVGRHRRSSLASVIDSVVGAVTAPGRCPTATAHTARPLPARLR